MPMAGEPRPLGPAALSAENWEVVFQQTLLFADYQVRRLLWRGQIDGILPGGFDPNSIAAQAIMDFLQQSPAPPGWSSPSPSLEERAGERRPPETLTPDSRLLALAPGFESILWEIKRLVLRQVSRLHHLKEDWLLSSEADLALVRDQDGDLVNPLELIPAPDVQPDEALIRKESFIEYAKLKLRFEVFLAKERRLLTLFELNCDGISKPQDLAGRLKLRVRTIENLQKRLRRKWFTFSKSPQTSHPEVIIRQE